MNTKQIFASALVAGVLGTAGVSVAGAVGDAGSGTDSTVRATDEQAARHPRARAALDTAAETIGIERADLVAAIRDGQTVAEVAQAHDVDPQAVVDALVAAANEHATERAEQFVNDTGAGLRDGQGHPGRRARIAGAALDTAAETIGIERADLVAAIRDGQTVAEVAQAHNVDAQTVIDALVAKANEKIDEALANEHIDEGHADEMRANAAARADQFVNDTRQPGEHPGDGPGDEN
jgi:transposase-like protein